MSFSGDCFSQANWITHPRQRCATTRIVDDLCHNSPDVATSLCCVKCAMTCRSLACSRVGREDAPPTFTLGADHATHLYSKTNKVTQYDSVATDRHASSGEVCLHRLLFVQQSMHFSRLGDENDVNSGMLIEDEKCWLHRL